MEFKSEQLTAINLGFFPIALLFLLLSKIYPSSHFTQVPMRPRKSILKIDLLLFFKNLIISPMLYQKSFKEHMWV